MKQGELNKANLFWRAEQKVKNNRKADGIIKPLELHKQFSQKISNGSCFPIGSSCQPCLVQADFSLAAWNGSMLLFWSRSGKQTRSIFSLPLNGRDSILLFWLALLYSPSPFSLGQIISSPTPFLAFVFGTKTI